MYVPMSTKTSRSSRSGFSGSLLDFGTGQLIDQFEVNRQRARITVFHPGNRELAWCEWDQIFVRRLTWREDPPIPVRQTRADTSAGCQP